MNVVDIIIVVIIGLSVVYGSSSGFIQTISNTVGMLVSIGAAFLLGPVMAAWLAGVDWVREILTNVTDAVARVGDFDLATKQVSGLSESTVDTVLTSVALPEPIANVLKDNLLGQSFADQGLRTVNDYVSNTIVAAALQVLGFLLAFLIAYIIISIIVSIIQHVFRFPILRQLDWLAGAAFGFIRGAGFIYLMLLLVPLISTALPIEGFDELMAASQLAHHFGNDGFFIRVITGG
ncbi:MAG TPA: CvpA family protein [Clostridiales bacterium]|nr:CvpA family protein [Clostridiales bacterium]